MNSDGKKYKVVNSWSKKDQIWVSYFDTEQNLKVRQIYSPWYFIIASKDLKKAELLLEKFCKTYKIQQSDISSKYTQLFVKDSEFRYIDNKYQLVEEFEKCGIQTFEGDLLPHRRWYLDHISSISESYTKLYFDIETDDTIPALQVGRDRILSFAAIDSAGKQYFEILKSNSDRSEKELLRKIISVLTQYSILLGWNSSNFDLPYIRKRIEKFELLRDKEYQNLKGVAKFDLIKRFRHIFRFDSNIRRFDLDSISKHFLGHGKLQHPGRIIDLWKNDKITLQKYNLEDCILIKELDEKLKVSDMMIRQAAWCRVPVKDFGLYSILDAVIIRIAHSLKQYVKTSRTAIQERQKSRLVIEEISDKTNPDETETRKNKYIGALVLDPKIGLYENVYSFDFKSLYPSLIRTSNIGYDTLRYEQSNSCIINPGTNTIPRLDKKIKPTFFEKSPSMIAVAITEMLTKRKEYKDLKLKMIEEDRATGTDWEKVVSDEIIVKELSNSIYGIMGLEYGRYYSVDVAESITLFGQWVIKYAKSFFETEGFQVLYGDTDSIFIQAEKNLNIQSVLDHFHYQLKKDLVEHFNMETCHIELNFDKFYEKFLLLAKKTYVGKVINIEGKSTDVLYARGLDYLKNNTFRFAARKQKELINLIFSRGLSQTEIDEWYQQTKKEFYQTSFSKDDLTILQRVSRAFSKYKVKPLHVQLAEDFVNRTGQYVKNSELGYIVINDQPKLQGTLATEWDGKTFCQDYYWYNKTQPVLQRVIEKIYPDLDLHDKELTPTQKRKQWEKSRQLTLF